MTAIAKGAWNKKHRPGAGMALAAVMWIVGVGPSSAQPRGAGAYFLPGDVKAGMQAFFDKGCARCHAVLGEGGRAAPDLARAPGGHLSAAELVAAMWNHAPAMWEKMRAQRLEPPKFSEKEMRDLFAFLYSVRTLDEPGDAQRGRRLVAEKNCLECHAIAGAGGRVGPDLKTWASYRNPVSWIQAMWNHAQPMQAAMAARGLSWPEFAGNDMTDLMAYVRTLTPNPRGHFYLRPADAEAGRKLFQHKGCAACHAVRGTGGGGAPDLGRRALPRTLGQLAGLMWNHAPSMWASMRAQHVPRPQFSNQEMADLIAYLFTERYFEAIGSAERGKRRFEEKGCAGCHGIGAVGPDLATWRGGGSVIPVATALWNHGPIMLEKMKEQRITWPRFRTGEIVDLMEYLNRGQLAGAVAKR